MASGMHSNQPAASSGGGAAAAGGGGSIAKVVPVLKSLRSVQDVWKWYTSPLNGGPSVQQREAGGDTTWRKAQKDGNQRWREMRLIIDRVEELQATGSAAGDISQGLAAAEEERTSLKLSVAGYMRHLRGTAQRKEQPDEQQGDGSDGSS